MSIRLLHPLPTKRQSWVAENSAKWLSFVRYPVVASFGDFVVWLWALVVQHDISTLYFIMVQSWLALSPESAKGSSRCTFKARVFAITSAALAVARLSQAKQQSKWPRWFQHAWKSLPPLTMQGICGLSLQWFTSVVEILNGQGGVSCVYLLFGFSGTYVGKANLKRISKGVSRPGVADRCVEHMTALTFPKSRDGGLPRYRVLRQAFATVVFLPLLAFQSELQCLSAERALINAMAPICNGADWTAVTGSKKSGVLLRPAKIARARPPPPLRGVKTPKTSVWVDLHFGVQLEKQKVVSSDEKLPKLPYAKLYRVIQDRRLATAGLFGPLPLFGKSWIPLFLAYAASVSPRWSFPATWGQGEIAAQVYRAASLLDKRLPTIGWRIAARRSLERVLRWWRLPPLCLRPWVVPATMLRNLRALRGLAMSSVAVIRNRHAKRWVLDNLKVVPARVMRWTVHVNAKKVLARTSLADFQGKPVAALSKLSALPSLQACLGPWRLPVWPTRQRIKAALSISWNEWSQNHRLPFHSQRKGIRQCKAMMESLQLPSPPDMWARSEGQLKRIVLSSRCRVYDDKLSTNVWTCIGAELFAAILAALADDGSWSVLPNLNAEDVRAVGHARALLGIPWFLRGRVGRSVVPGVPRLFAFIKSKCFSDQGVKCCTKPQHSCFRRVIDTSSVGFASAWRVLGRAVRAVTQAIGGHEVYDQSLAGQQLVQMLESLNPAATACKVCAVPLGGHLSLLSADVDQAFESCQGSNVSTGWSWTAETFRRAFNTDVVQIKRGKRFEARIGARPWSRGWWLLKLDDLARALLSATSLTLAVLGDVVVQLHGMSIGGSMSSSAVSVRFGYEEARAFSGDQCILPGLSMLRRGDVGWLRYVDDILSASRCVCACCMERFFTAVFSEPLSVVYSSCRNASVPCVWLHFELHVVGQTLSWTLKNANRAYLLGSYAEPFVPTFLPWPGALPYHFKQLRSLLISKLALAWSSQLSVVQSSLCILEQLLELHRLQYPFDLLRALVHSIPKVPAALLARRLFRSFLSVVSNSSSHAWTIGKGHEGRGGGRDNYSGGNFSSGSRQEAKRNSDKKDHGKRKDTPKSRRRDSSSSPASSSSTRERRARRIKSARSLLEKEDAEFLAFVKAKEDKKQELAYKRQCELLVGVLKEKFNEAILASGGHRMLCAQPGASTPSLQAGGNVLPGVSAPAQQTAGIVQPGPSGAFTEAQMEQLKVLLAGVSRGR